MEQLLIDEFGFVCINLQPEYELSSSTSFGQFQKIG